MERSIGKHVRSLVRARTALHYRTDSTVGTMQKSTYRCDGTMVTHEAPSVSGSNYPQVFQRYHEGRGRETALGLTHERTGRFSCLPAVGGTEVVDPDSTAVVRSI